MKKKSQMEIFGLAIIVVIITVAFFAYIGLKLRKPKDISSSYVDVEVAQRFVDSILDIKTECGASLTDIIKDCASTTPDLCPPDSCTYAHDTLQNAIDVTLAEWKKPYRLTVQQQGSPLFPEISSDCDDSMEREAPGIQPIPAVPMITVKLDICKR